METHTTWLVFLSLVCAVAEGTIGIEQTPALATAAACVVTVLNDSQRRIAVMGGRAGMPRSLGSVYAGAVTRFLDGFRGRLTRTIATAGLRPYHNGVAVSRDGSALLITDCFGGSHAVHIFSVHTGAVLRTIGGLGARPLQFRHPFQVWVASDGFVFVADSGNHRVQILTPRYDFHAFAAEGHVRHPVGVCADDEVIVVTTGGVHVGVISLFKRSDGALLRKFGREGCSDGQLVYPAAVCFMSDHKHVAVADYSNRRVSVFTRQGEFVRHVGEGTLQSASGIACFDGGELVVADWCSQRCFIFSTSGEIVWTSAACDCACIALHNSTIFAQTGYYGTCLVFS